MPTIKREDATAAQLLRFAEMRGLDVPGGASKSQIEALLDQAGIAVEEIDVLEPKRGRPAKVEEPIEGKVKAPANAWMTILIPEQEGTQKAVPVGVNGKAMFIERGKPSKVQFKHYRQVVGAKAMLYAETEKGGLGERREVSLYPVQILEADPEITRFLAYEAERKARLAEMMAA